MSSLFLVETAGGPEWEEGTHRREQAGWDEHASFMDRLVENGSILVGGPAGPVAGDRAVLVVAADTEEQARELFVDDPWYESVLRIDSVRPWTIWLGSVGPSELGAKDES